MSLPALCNTVLLSPHCSSSFALYSTSYLPSPTHSKSAIMVPFCAFPGELILKVITFILPEDLENFAQSCQRFHSLADTALQKHRLLIRQHHTAKNVGGRTIAKILKEVLVNPVIGRYIRDLSLNYIASGSNHKYSAEDVELFVTATTESKFLSPSGPASLACYRHFIEEGNEDILLAILLPLLPNLRSLRIPRVSNKGAPSWTTHVFSHLSYVRTPTLTKLSTIYINASGTYFHLDEAKPYANVPSVRSLCAPMLSCTDCSDASLYASLFSAPNSNITNLTLWECKVVAKPLYDFLLGFNCLQSFTYLCGLPDRFREEFNAFLIRSALVAKAKNTLRKLTILSGKRPSPVMGTLRPFVVLEEVCTDWGLLWSDVHQRRIAKKRFARSLPGSLRKLRLYEECGRPKHKYDELLGSALQAQKRGTHIQPQPHEDLVDFKYGLQLQALTLLCGAYPPENKAGLSGLYPPCLQHLRGRFQDCEEVGISLHHYVRGTEEWDRYIKLSGE